MPCFYPLKGYKSRSVNRATGKRSVTFNTREGFIDLPVSIPCGRCAGCRLQRSAMWAARCVHEAQLHEDNAFVTLTYNDEHLPRGGTLIKKHFQDFMKRLRRKYGHREISYYHCGEYGEACKVCRNSRRTCFCPSFTPGIGRPHYHALLFGLRFDDQLPYKKGADGSPVYTSEQLSLVWGLGFCTVGSVTFESAAYCARYVLKKMTGPPAAEHYYVADQDGELHHLLPEYVTMSLKRPIGKAWYEEYKRDVYPSDFVIMRGQKMKPPKYYDRLHDIEQPTAHQLIKEARESFARSHKSNSTPERLKVRETVHDAKMKFLKREL